MVVVGIPIVPGDLSVVFVDTVDVEKCLEARESESAVQWTTTGETTPLPWSRSALHYCQYQVATTQQLKES